MTDRLEHSADDSPPGEPAARENLPDEMQDWELGVSLDALLPIDDDDSQSLDLETGVEIPDPTERWEDGESTLDLGSDASDLLPIKDQEAIDDAEGADSDWPQGLPEVDDLRLEGDDEGPDSTLQDLGVPALPPLDHEGEPEDELQTEVLPADWCTPDEPRPEVLATAWSEIASGFSLEACGALTVAEGVVVAASSDLFWFTRGSLTPLRLEAGSARIRSLALYRTDWEYVICSTTGGRLLRRGRLMASSEDIGRGPSSLSLATGTTESLELCQLGPGYPHRLIVRTAHGQLLRSDDDGLSFRPVLERSVRAISSRGMPLVALTFDGSLLRSDDAGDKFEDRPLPEAVRRVLGGGPPLLAAHENLVVLAEPHTGVFVSCQNTETLLRVPGTSGVSAVCAGDWNGLACAWAALYDALDRSWIVRIDPRRGQAKTIARVDLADAEDDDAIERARVLRIEWDPAHRRLWLAGGFGLKVLTPPD